MGFALSKSESALSWFAVTTVARGLQHCLGSPNQARHWWRSSRRPAPGLAASKAQYEAPQSLCWLRQNAKRFGGSTVTCSIRECASVPVSPEAQTAARRQKSPICRWRAVQAPRRWCGHMQHPRMCVFNCQS